MEEHRKGGRAPGDDLMEDDQQQHQRRQVPVARRGGEDREHHAVGRLGGKLVEPQDRGLPISDDQNRDVENDQDVNGDHGGTRGDRSGEILDRFVHVELAHHREHDHDAEMPGGGDRGRVRNSDGSQFRDCRAEEGPRRDDQQTADEEGYDVVIQVSGFGRGESRGPHDRRCAECGNHEHRKIEQDGHSREQQLAVGPRAGAGTSDRPGDRLEQQVSEQCRTERDRKEHSRAGEHIPDRRGLQTPQAAETACRGAQAVPVVLNPLDEARRDLGNRREHAPADAWIELVGFGVEVRPSGALLAGRHIGIGCFEGAFQRKDQPVAGRLVFESLDQGAGRGRVGCRVTLSRRNLGRSSGERLGPDRIRHQPPGQDQEGESPEHVRRGKAVRRSRHRPHRRRWRSRGSDVPGREPAGSANSSGSAIPRPVAAAAVRTARESARYWRDRG